MVRSNQSQLRLNQNVKWVEFSINHPKVQDLPHKFDRPLRLSQFDEVIEYCKNDVRATRAFAEECRDIINLRIAQNRQYPDLRLLNKPDSSVGESIFLQAMSESMNVPMKDLKQMRTHRGYIDVKDIILPYINFKTPEFQAVHEFYKNARSGGLSYTVNYGGIDYEFGEGGLHASWNDRIFEADSEFAIIDIDVNSYYPNLAIVNNFRPEHLGQAFSKVYKEMYNKRKSFPKGSVENLSYKLLLNAVYGKSGDQYSFLYDPKMTLQICVNGQLLLAMLAERLSFIPQLTVCQANTDGISVRIRRKDIEKMNAICAKWEQMTGLELEHVEYRKMVISNVNNYMAQYTDGKVKEKGGLYLINSEPHKNKSQRVVRIALRRYFFEGIPIRETVENYLELSKTLKGLDYDAKSGKYKTPFHGIYDFCLGRKVQWNQHYVIYRGMEEIPVNEKVIRYYITRDRATMMKKYSDGRIEAVNKGYNARLFQNYSEESDYRLNYEYYINEAYKVTTPFDRGNPKIGKQLSLFD